jgi:perosamine synthetase
MFKEFVEFVHKLYKTDEYIPLHAATFIGNEKKYLNECIDSTYVSSVGKFVDRFEKMLADYTNAKKTVVCVNGTNALHIALLLVGVEKDDEVITQSLTFIASCNAISYIGAHPVFIDVDLDTMGLSPTATEMWLLKNAMVRDNACYNIKTGRKIKACMPMHTFGHPVHLNELLEVCEKYHLKMVEDAAESMGSFYNRKHTGTFGDIGVISFNGNKTITTGGGGMLLFRDEELGNLAKHLTTQAKVPHRWDFIHDQIGYNYRLPNINAAIGCAQMENLDRYLLNKREIANKYKSFFSQIPDVQFFDEPANCLSNFWLNTILLKDKNMKQEFLQYTNDHGIMTRPVWGLMNKLPMYKNCQTDGLENTAWFEHRVINIPSSVCLK